MCQYILRTCKMKSVSFKLSPTKWAFKHKKVTLIRKYRHVHKKPNSVAVYTLNLLSDQNKNAVCLAVYGQKFSKKYSCSVWEYVDDLSRKCLYSWETSCLLYLKTWAALSCDKSVLKCATFTPKNLMSQITVLCERQEKVKKIKMSYCKLNDCWTGHLLSCPQNVLWYSNFIDFSPSSPIIWALIKGRRSYFCCC